MIRKGVSVKKKRLCHSSQEKTTLNQVMIINVRK